MSHNIPLSDGMFARLQSHAVPLVDTIESVIGRALDALEAPEHGKAATASGPRAFNPATPPNLAYTTPKAISLCGQTFMKGEVYWNTLMYSCIREAAKTGLSAKEIGALMVVPFAVGEKTDNGYKFLEDAGISVQGQDSNGAWKQVYRIAEKLGFNVTVEFTWQNNEKAAHPNLGGSFMLN